MTLSSGTSAYWRGMDGYKVVVVVSNSRCLGLVLILASLDNVLLLIGAVLTTTLRGTCPERFAVLLLAGRLQLVKFVQEQINYVDQTDCVSPRVTSFFCHLDQIQSHLCSFKLSLHSRFLTVTCCYWSTLLNGQWIVCKCNFNRWRLWQRASTLETMRVFLNPVFHTGNHSDGLW